jgi:conjugative transposon TraK protein
MKIDNRTMFRQTKNIDTAFRHIRGFTILLVVACTVICCFTLYTCFQQLEAVESRIYILANGKALEAYASERKDNIPVEARDHVKTFHQLFFTLDPDENVIRSNVTNALYLADGSAKREYDNLKESGYYSSIISGNISQQIKVDSIRIDIDEYPYSFVCYAMQSLIRTTSTVHRSLVTKGFLRNVSRSDNNPHGFLIENWTTVENRDIKVEKR